MENGLKLSCCGNFYISNGDDFYKISRYKTDIKNRIKSFFKGQKVKSETIYVAVCEHCGHYIVKLTRKTLKSVETENFRGKQADEFFYSNYSKFIEVPLESPFADIRHSKTIPFIYGKTINSQTQQPYYIDESGNAGNQIQSKILIKKI